MTRAQSATLLVTLLSILALGPAAHAELDAETAIGLVTADWYEGMPVDRIERLDAEAVEALEELLADVGQARYHATALELLGRAGGPGAYAAIAHYEAATSTSSDAETPGAIHRARLAVPIALGFLARTDDRALQHLVDASAAETPRWRTKSQDADKVARLHREMCATGLGLSGRPAAKVAIQRMQRRGDAKERAGWDAYAAEALAEHGRAARENGRAR